MERVLTHLALILAAVICAALLLRDRGVAEGSGFLFHYPPVWVQIRPTGNYERLLFDSGFRAGCSTRCSSHPR